MSVSDGEALAPKVFFVLNTLIKVAVGYVYCSYK